MRHYQRVVAEVNLENLLHNFKQIKSYISKGTKICSVIKADAYGHGSVPVAKTLNEAGVDAFAVAASQEAIALRKNGISCQVLVLGYTGVDDYFDMVKHDITQTVFRLDMAKSLSEVALQMQKKAHIHIKIDTGMGRIGFMPNDESARIIKEISELPMIQIDGFFTHFARADEKDKTASMKQLKLFREFMADLRASGIATNELHMSNSAGLIDIHEADFNMVRVGIAMYGLYPSEEVQKDALELRPVLSLKSNIILVKDLPEGYAISYGGRYVTSKTTRVATIPVGYGDGYPRSLSCIGRVLIRGQEAPILGSVCMDQFMVDVSDIEGVSEGDTAVLIGSSGNQHISVEEIAGHMGTINYEVVCQLGKRIPRVYVREGKPVYSIDYFG